MAKLKQNGKLDEDSLEVEDEFKDEYNEEIKETEDGEEAVNESLMEKATSAFNLSNGAKLAVVGVIIVIIVGVLFFSKMDNFSIKSLFGLRDKDGSLASDMLGNSDMTYEESLVQYLEGYKVTKNEDETFDVTGEIDGVKHILVYDGNFNVIKEVKGEEIIEYVDNGEGEFIPKEILTADNTNIVSDESTIVEGDGMVKVDKWSYDHSTLSLPKKELNPEYGEDGGLISSYANDKYIAEFTKLPLRGNMAQIHLKFLETDYQLIMTIGIDSYLKMESKGTTVISARITEVGGQVFFDEIGFHNWK